MAVTTTEFMSNWGLMMMGAAVGGAFGRWSDLPMSRWGLLIWGSLGFLAFAVS